MTLSMMGLFATYSINDKNQNDTQHDDIHRNDTQHNAIQHNDIQQNGIHQNDTQHIDTQHDGIFAAYSINDTWQNNSLPLC
jgi:hypothetical protein